MMGDVCLSATGFAGSCRSYARGTVENGAEACARAASSLEDAGAEAEAGIRTRRADPKKHAREKADADDGARPIIVTMY
jgi:hypothetical protein